MKDAKTQGIRTMVPSKPSHGIVETLSAHQVAVELAAQFPDADAELYVRRRRRGPFEQYQGPLNQITRFMLQVAEAMPGHFTQYCPSLRHGVVAAVFCSCEVPPPECAGPCLTPDERPRVLLRLARVGQRDILVG